MQNDELIKRKLSEILENIREEPDLSGKILDQNREYLQLADKINAQDFKAELSELLYNYAQRKQLERKWAPGNMILR